MANYIKWLGGTLGWALGGPIGGILGFLAGSFFDDPQPQQAGGAATQGQADFSVSLLVLAAAVMKADGKILRGELDYIKAFFVRNFGTEVTQHRMLLLRDLMKQSISVPDVGHQIAMHIDYQSRVQMLHFLFGIAAADGAVVKEEVTVLHDIARSLGIADPDWKSIQAMFVQDATAAYKILEIDPKANDDEVKKAYRKMAVQFHPDKVSHLGEEYHKDAEEKFKKIQEAYDIIKKERNLT